jgi:colicin import membrane protein
MSESEREAKAEAAAEKARADKAEAELVAANARADKAEGERDAEKSRADKADAAADKARTDAASIDIPALVAARSSLESSARAVLGTDATLTVKADSGSDARAMTDAEIVTAVITKDDPSFKVDGKSNDYLRARFDAVTERTNKANDAHRQAALAITDAANGNASEKTKTELAQEKVDAENAEAAKAGPPKGALVKK